jgi:MFS family permease
MWKINRWHVLAAGLFVNLYCGVTYAFGLYSDVLKDTFKYSQTDLTTVASIGNIAGFFAVPSGMVYDKYGPKTTILIGVATAFLGYFLLWMAVRQYFDAGLATVCLFAAIANNCQTWFDTASVVTNMSNFPNNRGAVVGVLKSMNGLGASVFSQIYTGLFEQDTTGFMLTLPFLASVPFVSAFIVRKVPPKQCQAEASMVRFHFAYALTATIAIFVLVVSIISSTATLNKLTGISVTMSMCVLLGGFFFLPYRADKDGEAILNQALLDGGKVVSPHDTFSPGHVTYSRPSSRGSSRASSRGSSGAGRPKNSNSGAPKGIQVETRGNISTSALFAPSQTKDTLEQGAEQGAEQDAPVTEGDSPPTTPEGKDSRPPSMASEFDPTNPSDLSVASSHVGGWEEPRSYTLKECLRRADFYLLFGVLTIGTGAGLTIVNNITQISQSLKVTEGGGTNDDLLARQCAPGEKAVFVSLISVANCFGRSKYA